MKRMMRMLLMKRLTACLLCLALLLPALALSEDEARAVRFDLSFQMDATAYPEDDQEILSGIADMLNILTLSGVYTWKGNSFDLNADALLENAEETRTNFHLYGLDSHWQLESSLLGDQKVMFNMLAYLEFAMKAYFHLDMPLQYIALCTSRFATESAFWELGDAWNSVMNAQSGSRVIAREDVLALAGRLAEIASSDRNFEYWLKALTLDLGYDDAIMESLEALPDWADSFLGEDGLTVAAADGSETWSTGDTVLFTRTQAEDRDAWSLELPATLDGYSSSVTYTREGGAVALHIGATSEDPDDLLNINLSATDLPESLPLTGSPTLALDMDGEMLGVMAQHLRLEGKTSGDTLTLTQTDAATGAPMLTVTAALLEEAPTVTPSYAPDDLDGLNIFSVDDNSLGDFVSAITEPFTKGMMPVLLHLPATSYTSIFALLNQYGVLDLLTGSGE